MKQIIRARKNTPIVVCMIDNSTIFFAAADWKQTSRYRCRWRTFRRRFNENLFGLTRRCNKLLRRLLDVVCERQILVTKRKKIR